MTARATVFQSGFLGASTAAGIAAADVDSGLGGDAATEPEIGVATEPDAGVVCIAAAIEEEEAAGVAPDPGIGAACVIPERPESVSRFSRCKSARMSAAC